MQLKQNIPVGFSLHAQKITNHSYFYPILYLVAITLAEAITTLSFSEVGLVLHGALLVALLLHGSWQAQGKLQRFLLSLTLVPLIRLMSLSLPLVSFPFVTWYMIIGAPLLIAAFFTAKAIGYSPWRVGLRMKLYDVPLQALVTISGIGLGYLEYVILRPEPLVTEFSLANVILPALILLFFTGLLEEVIFRGLLQSTSKFVIGRMGIWYVAMIFAVMHLGYKSVLDFVFVFAVAIYFSIVVMRTGTIVGVTLAHGLTNIGLFLVFPFLLGPVQQSAPFLSNKPTPVITVAQVSAVQMHTATPAPLFTVTATAAPITEVLPTLTSTPTAAPVIVDGSEPIIVDDRVDDRTGDFQSSGGNRQDAKQGYMGDLLWAYESTDQVEVTAEWMPQIPMCGQYRVEVYLPDGYARSHYARYVIDHHDGASEVVLDQAAFQGNWASLGTFNFDPQSPASLKLENSVDTQGEQSINVMAFDAARWTWMAACGTSTQP